MTARKRGNWQRQVPLSCWLLIFTGMLYLILLCTPLREGLAPLQISWWPVVTVNLAFLLMLHDGLRGDSPPLVRMILMGFAIAYVTGYSFLVILSGQEMTRRREVIRSENAAVRIPFHPSMYALQFEHVAEEGLADLPIRLVSAYDADNVYELPPGDDGSGLWFHQFGEGGMCDRMREIEKHGTQAQVVVHAVASPGGPPRCVISSRTIQARAFFVISSQRGRQSSWLADRELISVRVIAPSGERYNLTAGREFGLDWYPLPVIACGEGHLACWPEFARRREASLVSEESESEATARLIADAMGLMPRMAR